MPKDERNWYDEMPAEGVEYSDGESKDGLVTPVVWEGSAQDVAETGQTETRGEKSEGEVGESKVAETSSRTLDPKEISELTVKELEEKVEAGELAPDEIYKAESVGKQRKSVLEAYKPEEDAE